MRSGHFLSPVPTEASGYHSFLQTASQVRPVRRRKVPFSAMRGLPRSFPGVHRLPLSGCGCAGPPAHSAWLRRPVAALRFCTHYFFRTLPVTIGDFIVVGHALVHLGQLALQLARRTIEHHQNGRRVKGPAAAFLDADGKAGHLSAGAAVQKAHGADIVVAEEAHDQVALTQQVAPFFRRQLRMLLNGSQQERFQFQHFWDIPPVEHTAHQYQNRQRMRFQHGSRARLNIGEHDLRIKRREQNTRVFLYDAQQGVVISAPSVRCYGVQILSVVFVPQSEAFQI